MTLLQFVWFYSSFLFERFFATLPREQIRKYIAFHFRNNCVGEGEKTMDRNKRMKPLGVFFALLAICTYLSASFQSLLAAKVTLYTPESRIMEDNTYVCNIIPGSALVDGQQLYIAVKQEDIWGTYLVARPITVSAKDIGDGQISIVEGLVGNEPVIISWDRPLDFGTRVIEE